MFGTNHILTYINYLKIHNIKNQGINGIIFLNDIYLLTIMSLETFVQQQTQNLK
jgi:hypothetical protein